LKKIITCLLLFALMLSSVNINAAKFADIADESLSVEIKFFTDTGIMNGYPDGTFRPESNITRAEFAALLARVMKFSSGSVPSGFADVPESHFASGAVSYVSSMGYMKGTSATTFEPEENIKVVDVMTTLIRLTGYEAMAEDKGGYPYGYISVAYSIDLCDNLEVLNTDSPATRNECAVLLYNALFVNTLEPVYGTSDYQISDNCLYDMYFSSDENNHLYGIVEATEMTSIYDYEGCDENRVVIGGKLYDSSDVDISALLGYGVEIHLTRGKSSSVPKIISAVSYNTEITEIKSKDINEISDDYLTYFENENAKKDYTLKFDEDMRIIYNGKYLEPPYKMTNIIPSKGDIRVIDNDSDGRMEVMFVDEYSSFIVERVNVNSSSILLKNDKFNGQSAIHLDPSGRELEYILVDENGDAIELGEINEWNVVSVKSDKKQTAMTLIVSNKTVSGTSFEIDHSDDSVIIDGVKYDVTFDINDFEADKENIYLVDAFGNIVGINEDEISEKSYSVVSDVNKSKSLDGKIMLKLVFGGKIKETTEDKKGSPITYEVANSDVQVFTLADKVKYNGSSVPAEDVYAGLAFGSPITYGTNVNGEINRIDTLYSDGKTSDKAFNPDVRAFGGEFCLDENSIVIICPSNETNNDDDYYLPVELASGINYTVLGYDVDEENDVAKLAVITTELSEADGYIKRNAQLAVVTKAKQVIDEAGDTVLEISGWCDGEEFSHKVNDNVDSSLTDRLSRGALIYFTLNSKNIINNIEYVDNVNTMDVPFHKGNSYGANERIFGTLYTLKKERLNSILNNRVNEFGISLNGHKVDNVFSIAIGDMPVIYSYDSRLGEVEVIDVYDLMPYEEYMSNASEIFIAKRNFEYTGIVVIK